MSRAKAHKPARGQQMTIAPRLRNAELANKPTPETLRLRQIRRANEDHQRQLRGRDLW